MSEEEIFHEALAREPAERAEYLDQSCSGDPALRSAVEALLRANEGATGFLAAPPEGYVATVDLASSTAGPVVAGRYKLLEEIGEGGMGTVWMAEQTEPIHRRVAVKLIKAGMDSKQVAARFEAERQALALMDHPNIAKVLDGGATGDGRPFFVMELVKGTPITKYCDEKKLPVRERLELFGDVCRAVQHAHQKGIIHRDLKPSNVMVAPYDGRAVVKVIDFGVAKAAGQKLTEATLFTGFGAVVGTPEYMSPEQAELNNADIDTRSDIYSLGVLVYELLTGTTPHTRQRLKDAALLEVLRVIREEEPPRPSTRLSSTDELPSIAAVRGVEPAKLSRLLRGELDWIVMKSLEKDRTRRYETASGLAADVQRYLEDEPVQACPPSAWYRFRKLARRNRRSLVTVAALTLAALVGIGALAVSTVLVWTINQELKKSVDRERIALDRERCEAYFQRITVAHRELSMNNLAAALRALHDCPEDLRDWEWHCLMRLCKVEPVIIQNTTEVRGVAFSPTGDRLASAGGDGIVKIWNSTTGKMIHDFPAHTDAVVSVAFHPDGKHLATRGADLELKVWDLTTGQAVLTERCDAVRSFGTAYTVAFSPDGRLLAAGTDGVVKVWDWKNRQLLHRLPGNYINSIPVAFSGDGRLATSSFGEGLKVWDPNSGTPLRIVPAHDDPVSAVAFSADGRWLASASFDRTVRLSDSTTGEILHTLSLHTGNVECVAISPVGRRLASGGEDKAVRVWDATTGREILGLRGHTDRCECVAFSPDGFRLASASPDRTIRIWDGTPLREDEGGEEILTFTGHSHEIRGVAFSPEGQRIVSASSDGTVRVWDAQTGQASTVFSDHREAIGRRFAAVFCVAWHPKGRLIASSSIDTVRVWDAWSGREAFRLPVAQRKFALPYHALAFSPDGRYLVTGKADGAVQVWDGGTGQEVSLLGTHKREIRGVVFSPDRRHLATASSDGEVKLWDAMRLDKSHMEGKPDPRVPPIRARVAGPGLSVAFSPDGRRLVTGGEKNTLKIWDVVTGQELRTLGEHGGEVYTLAVSPDGRWIASGSEDSTVKIWDARSGEWVHTFRHTGIVTSVAFSPDGGRLVSGSRDGTVKVWDLTPLSKVPER